MRKRLMQILIILLCAFCIIFYARYMEGSSKVEPIDIQVTCQDYIVKEETTETLIEESDINVANEYWNENVSSIFEVTYSEDEGYETQTTELDISSVKELENGTIYKLEIEAEIPVDRFPVYLYVTEEKIYRLWETEEGIELLESETDFIEESMIVCQKENLQEVYGEGPNHEIISGENDDVRVSRFWQSDEYGDTVGFWERFYWEKEEGLIGYRSGYRAGADLVELTCAQGSEDGDKESEFLIGNNDASVVVMESEFFDMIAANPIDEDMKWEHLGSPDRIYRACQYRDAWIAEIGNSLMILKEYLTEEDYQSLVESYQGWRQYMDNNTALEQQLFYAVTDYTQENTGLPTGDGNTYPYTMEITAERTKHYAIQLKSLEYALTGTIEFVYGTDKSTIDVAENLLLDGKKHFVCDEEKKKNRTYPEETAGKEVYETRDGWEEISIYEEDGNICFEYFIPRETTYEGVVIDCQDGVLNVELTDFRDYKMKASFIPVDYHYEFVITECDYKYIGNLPRTIEFYRTDKTYSEDSLIVYISDVDEERCQFSAEASGIYAEYVEYQDTIYVEYSCMEDTFIQEADKYVGKTAIINYTEYDSTYIKSLNEIDFDESNIVKRNEEIYDYSYNAPDLEWPLNNYYWTLYSGLYSATQHEYIKEDDTQSSKVFLGAEFIKNINEGQVSKLYLEENGNQSFCGYLLVESEHIYMIDNPDFDALNATYEEFVQAARHICSNENIEDVNANGVGLQETITIVGDTCEYRSIDKVTGKILNITWCDKYGILRYESGYSDGREHMVLNRVMPPQSKYN